MLHLRKVSQLGPKRFLSTVKSTLEHLNDRALLKVSGNEVADFLQGLITNDMRHLSSGPGSMYSMFLNTRGRIIYDTIIYRPTENDTYLVECDKSAVTLLERHLKMYRVRRKIEVRNLDNEYKIYCVYKTENADTESDNNSEIIESGMPQSSIKIHKNLWIYKDPRLQQLGSRIITKSEIDVTKEISDLLPNINLETDKRNYKWLRYSLGVGEGTLDLPIGTSFPLECNCDYLHGVSFHKGCYVGQELTARVHHTGMVRKRLMPLDFVKIPTKTPDESVSHGDVNLGKFRGLEGDKGLALLRIEKVLKLEEITIGDGVAKVEKPFWWPREIGKDKILNKVMAATSSSSDPQSGDTENKPEEIPEKEEIKYFECALCDLKEPYEYFGNSPNFVRQYKLLENAYIIEDPFLQPKKGEIIILGAHCIKCGDSVCKDSNCSIYYSGTFCIKCAKSCSRDFPKSIQDKLERVVLL